MWIVGDLQFQQKVQHHKEISQQVIDYRKVAQTTLTICIDDTWIVGDSQFLARSAAS